ncbi:hypothetical protein CK215_26730 [Mesorhizobium sp. WSM3864]|uniref:hypothetical protein n=1 Tax=Mesorhizobium sp. WSM3864 TaxID=2029404 RepID=UPI000BB041E8|nr:hypothetical protein [Mesorhizobium sp. WSM3864]PBB89633.1 hypothetical protein CK215_26730 [Mesorhizobium sp. WSM3864]
MDCFKKLETLIDAGGANAAGEARALLADLKAKSQVLAEAVDEFLLDMMTLDFLLESEREAFQSSARRLAQRRLTMVRLLST